MLVGTVLMGIIMGAGLVGSMASMDMNSNFGTGVGIGTMIFGFVVYIIFGILSIIKFYKALNSIGIEYNVPLMQLVAKGYIVGIVLVPLFGLGYLILFVAFIAKIFAYLKIEKQ
mgnify:FL=1